MLIRVWKKGSCCGSLVSKKPIFMCYFNVLRDKGQYDILHRLEERITNFL